MSLRVDLTRLLGGPTYSWRLQSAKRRSSQESPASAPTERFYTCKPYLTPAKWSRRDIVTPDQIEVLRDEFLRFSEDISKTTRSLFAVLNIAKEQKTPNDDFGFENIIKQQRLKGYYESISEFKERVLKRTGIYPEEYSPEVWEELIAASETKTSLHTLVQGNEVNPVSRRAVLYGVETLCEMRDESIGNAITHLLNSRDPSDLFYAQLLLNLHRGKNFGFKDVFKEFHTKLHRYCPILKIDRGKEIPIPNISRVGEEQWILPIADIPIYDDVIREAARATGKSCTHAVVCTETITRPNKKLPGFLLLPFGETVHLSEVDSTKPWTFSQDYIFLLSLNNNDSVRTSNSGKMAYTSTWEERDTRHILDTCKTSLQKKDFFNAQVLFIKAHSNLCEMKKGGTTIPGDLDRLYKFLGEEVDDTKKEALSQKSENINQLVTLTDSPVQVLPNVWLRINESSNDIDRVIYTGIAEEVFSPDVTVPIAIYKGHVYCSSKRGQKFISQDSPHVIVFCAEGELKVKITTDDDEVQEFIGKMKGDTHRRDLPPDQTIAGGGTRF